MTGLQLLKQSIALMHETDTTIYEVMAPSWINIVAAELYAVNNLARAEAGKPPISEPPYTDDLGDEIIYEPRIVREAMVLGLTCRAFAADDNNPLLNMYKQEYALARENGAVLDDGQTVDLYE